MHKKMRMIVMSEWGLRDLIHTEKPTHSTSHGLARTALCALVLMCGTAVTLREQEEKRRLWFEPGQRIGLMSRLRSLRRRGLWGDRSSGSETR